MPYKSIQSLKSIDGLSLHSAAWKIESSKFNVIIVHGLGEHLGRYAHVAEFYNSLGANAYALDLRGHGQSEGDRGCGPDLNAFLDDVNALISLMKKESPNLPWIFHLHSMGANVGLNYVLRRNPDCKAVVATGPWITIENTPSKALVMVANLINKFGGFTQSSEIDPSFVSTDKAEVEKYVNDPLNHDKISSKAGMALYHSGQFLYNYKEGMPVPTLIMHAKQDKLTLATGSQQFATNNPQNVTLKLWDDVNHELHNDVKREELFADIKTWLVENSFNF
jgi:alpha-beta hydrolase superfamily lysophospholipase